MVILHLLSQLELTGAEVYMQALSKEQVSEGHTVLVVSDKIHVSLSSQCSAHYLPVSSEGFFQRRAVAKELERLVVENNVDIVHCHSRAAVRIANLALKNSKTPYVTSVHGIQHFSWSKKFIDIYGEYIGFICENARFDFLKNFNVSEGKTRVFRNPLDLRRFSFHQEKSERKTIGYVARTSGPKGKILKNFLESGVFEVLEKNPDFTLEVIVSGEVSVEFEKNIEKVRRQFGERFVFKNSSPDLSQEYPKYNLVIGSGRVAIEAILMGCKVFAIGEAECLGLVDQSNWEKALHSNFGDISPTQTSDRIEVNPTHLNESLKKKLSLFELSELARNCFSSLELSKQTIAFYRDAVFKKNTPKWIPILMYHKVPQKPLQSQHRTFVTVANFRKHLEFFKFRKFETLHFKDLFLFWSGQKPFSDFPKRPLILTFDDGYVDTLTEAQPLLQSFRMKANLFLLGESTFETNSWDDESDAIMNQDQRSKLDLKTFEIGAHGLTHTSYVKASESQVLEEMTSSKKNLESEFGQKVISQAYPYGDTKPELSSLSEKSGYIFSVNTDRGGLLLTDDRHQIFRVNIFPEETWFTLWKKTSSWYRKYYFKKRGQ